MIQAARRLLPALLIGSLAAVPQAQTSRAGDAKTQQIYVSAVDGKGAPVTGLTAADFVVREDGKPREVVDARPADYSETPLQLALVIDDSEAASDATMQLREGLAAMLERLHGKAEIALITIGERPTVLANYTKDTEQLKQRTNRLFPRPGAGAYLLDALLDTSNALGKREAARPTIVAVSFEGVDYSNRHSEPVLTDLRRSGAALHVITVGTPSGALTEEMRNRNRVIAEGTERSGGRREQVLAVSGLPEKLKQLADELVNQYVLTYSRPDMLIPPDKLEVSSTRRDVKVRARTRLGSR